MQVIIKFLPKINIGSIIKGLRFSHSDFSLKSERFIVFHVYEKHTVNYQRQ